ncbi:MAG: ABC transporter permease [Corallococcus sp.]|nr:ABC transporter permease [Corallococcus sp.]
MISILSAELYRLKKSKIFWILLGLCVALPLISLVITLALVGIIETIFDDTLGMGAIGELLRAMDMTNLALTDLSALLNDAALLALICSGVVLSKEFTDSTMRNVILANKSRRQMYFAYLLTAIIIGASYMMTYFATILIIYAPIYGFGDITAGQAASACFCSLALGLLTIAFAESCVVMFLFSIKKQWATILFPMLICMFAPGIVESIVSLVQIVMMFQNQVLDEAVISWLPFANVQLYNSSSIDGGLVGKIALYYILFTAVFIVSGYYTFEKKDLK